MKEQNPNVIRGYSRQDGTQFLIRYFKEVEEKYNKRKGKKEYALLSSIYKSNYVVKQHINFFRRLVIHDNRENRHKNRPDQFCYDIEGNIIIGSAFCCKRLFIDGACFEKLDKKSLVEALYRPVKQIKDYSNFDLSSGGFAILYAGYSYANNTTYYHDLEITKRSDRLQIKYRIEDLEEQNCILNAGFELSNLSLENITLTDIDIIIQKLQSLFADDEFIQFVINELQRFKAKLEIKNGLVQEIIGPLSPELLIGETFDEIQALISANKDDCFKIISEQFESAVNASIPIVEAHHPILKSVDYPSSNK